MDTEDAGTIHQHLKALREEIAQIRAADRRYRLEVFHTPLDRAIHNDQVLRLKQIMEELAELSGDKIPSKPKGGV
jgi:hypothetical protein